MQPKRFWIAINGATAAMYPIPLREPVVIPTPPLLIGFATERQAREAQRTCLESEIDEVQAYLGSLHPQITLGRIRIIQPDNPQPPTEGPTLWSEGVDDGPQAA